MNGKYLKYAIGEILLVVIGIFIAISLNSLKEQRKAQKELDLITVTLKKELSTDTVYLKSIIANSRDMLIANQSIQEKMQLASTNLDTIKRLAYEEFSPILPRDVPFGELAINRLESSGLIELFDGKIKLPIIKHYQVQRALSANTNTNIYLESINLYTEKYAFRLKGVSSDNYLNKTIMTIENEREFLVLFNQIVTYRSFMLSVYVNNCEGILKSTSELLQTLKDRT